MQDCWRLEQHVTPSRVHTKELEHKPSTNALIVEEAAVAGGDTHREIPETLPDWLSCICREILRVYYDAYDTSSWMALIDSKWSTRCTPAPLGPDEKLVPAWPKQPGSALEPSSRIIWPCFFNKTKFTAVHQSDLPPMGCNSNLFLQGRGHEFRHTAPCVTPLWHLE